MQNTTRAYRLRRRITNLQWADRTLGQDRSAEIAELRAELRKLAA